MPFSYCFFSVFSMLIFVSPVVSSQAAHGNKGIVPPKMHLKEALLVDKDLSMDSGDEDAYQDSGEAQHAMDTLHDSGESEGEASFDAEELNGTNSVVDNESEALEEKETPTPFNRFNSRLGQVDSSPTKASTFMSVDKAIMPPVKVGCTQSSQPIFPKDSDSDKQALHEDMALVRPAVIEDRSGSLEEGSLDKLPDDSLALEGEDENFNDSSAAEAVGGETDSIDQVGDDVDQASDLDVSGSSYDQDQDSVTVYQNSYLHLSDKFDQLTQLTQALSDSLAEALIRIEILEHKCGLQEGQQRFLFDNPLRFDQHLCRENPFGDVRVTTPCQKKTEESDLEVDTEKNHKPSGSSLGDSFGGKGKKNS